MMKGKRSSREVRMMKMNEISRVILNNWPIKVFSFLLALFIFIIIHFTTFTSREVEVPLRVIFPTGYTAVSTVPESVTLIFQGKDASISKIRTDAVETIADFSLVREEGVSEQRVQLIYDSSLFDIEFSVTSDPATVKIYYEKESAGVSE